MGDVHPNPVVELNAAIAVAEVEGPAAALDRLDGVDPSARSHLWHVGRAEMLVRLDRSAEAAAAFRSALAAAPTEPERRHLTARLLACGGDTAATSDGPRE